MEPRQDPNLLPGLDAVQALEERREDLQLRRRRTLPALPGSAGPLLDRGAHVPDWEDFQAFQGVHISGEYNGGSRSRTGASAERHDGSAPATGFRRSVTEFQHEGSFGQDRADNFALHANASAVNDSQSFEPEAVGFFQVGLHDIFHVARRYRMQIENVRNRNANRIRFRFHDALKTESPISRS